MPGHAWAIVVVICIGFVQIQITISLVIVCAHVAEEFKLRIVGRGDGDRDVRFAWEAVEVGRVFSSGIDLENLGGGKGGGFCVGGRR